MIKLRALAASSAVVLLARVCRSYAIVYPASESILFANARMLMLARLNVRIQRQRDPLLWPTSSLLALQRAHEPCLPISGFKSGEVGLPRYRNQADRSRPQPPRHADSATMMLRRRLPGYRACRPSSSIPFSMSYHHPLELKPR